MRIFSICSALDLLRLCSVHRHFLWLFAGSDIARHRDRRCGSREPSYSLGRSNNNNHDMHATPIFARRIASHNNNKRQLCAYNFNRHEKTRCEFVMLLLVRSSHPCPQQQPTQGPTRESIRDLWSTCARCACVFVCRVRTVYDRFSGNNACVRFVCLT